MLRKPKRTRGTTQQNMDIVMKHIYAMRVATIQQLVRLLCYDIAWEWGSRDSVQEPALRRQLDRYPYISERNVALNEYVVDAEKWQHVTNVTMYYLDKQTTHDYESKINKSYYRANPKRNPVPDESTLEHHILMGELYVQMYTQGSNMDWLSNVAFNHEFAKLRTTEELDMSMRVPALAGVTSEQTGLWGFGIYSNQNMNGFKRSLSTYIPQHSLFNSYNLLVFITAERSGDAQRRLIDVAPVITIRNPELPERKREPLDWVERVEQQEAKERRRLDPRKHVYVLPYEWAVRNPDIVEYVLHNDRASLIERLLFSYMFIHHNWSLEKSKSYAYEWILYEGDGYILMDTTIGKTPAEIYDMIKSREPYLNKRVLVPTQEERDVWQKFASQLLVNIEFVVVDPRRDDMTYRDLYDDVFGPPITTPDEFDEAFDRWLLSGIS